MALSTLLLLLTGGGWLDLPLSLPPLPEDPAISRAAPEECLWYLSLAGVAKPDKASKNQTEQLLAEEEVQRFVLTVTTQVRAAIARQGAPGRQEAVASAEGPKLVLAILTHPTAAFVSQVQIGPNGPDVTGGAIVNTGADTAEIKKSLAALEALLPQGVQPPGKWHRLPAPGPGPVVEWGFDEQYFILGIGEGSADAIAARRKQSAVPKWLAAVRKAVPVERPAMFQYVNVKRILEVATPLAATQGVDVKNVAEALGLSNVQYLATVTGLDAGGYVSKALVATDGKPQGLLALGESKPLSAKDLAAIPADATIAAVARCDLAKALDQVLAMAGKIEPQGAEQARRSLADLESQFGFNLKDDVLAALGDTWSVYSSPGEGGLLITGMTLVAPVRDRARLAKVEQRLAAMLPPTESAIASGQRGPALGTFDFRGQKISFVSFIGEPAPIAPSWCITDKELIVSFFPQTIKAHLARPAKAGSLADVPAVAKQFKTGGGPSVISYQDTATMVRTLYPLVEVGATMAASALQREGIDLNASLLPSSAAILPHLSPSITTVTSGNDGIRLETHATLPINAAGPALILPWFMLVPSSGGPSPLTAFTPGGADRMASSNNLKQLALAMHNYHAAFNKFPSATGAGKDGKPLLSWRVHLLPFVEQEPLYRQFNLDEPWDSDHNKKLIENMPKIFAAPGSKAAGEHKTTYLTPRGDDTMFPANRQLNFGDILDGTHNTLMIVEANDEKAVVWTKPDDFDATAENPMAGLVGLRRGGFLAALGDGSVQLVPEGIGKDNLHALFTRAGGEPFYLDQIIDQTERALSVPTTEESRPVPRAGRAPDNGPAKPPREQPRPVPKKAKILD